MLGDSAFIKKQSFADTQKMASEIKSKIKAFNKVSVTSTMSRKEIEAAAAEKRPVV